MVRRELAAPKFPSRSDSGPDYGDLLPATLCQCPDCRRKRGELEIDEEEFDEDKMEEIFYKNAPPDLPPDLARKLFEVMKEAFLSGEDPEEIISQILGDEGGEKKKKGRKKR